MSESRGFNVGDYSFESERIFNTELRHDDGPDNRKPATNQEFAGAVWEIMDELGNLLITKQMDYGPGNINNAHGGPINGLLVRIGDKFERLKNLFSKEARPNFESIEDSFKDLANYAVIGILVQKGKWPKQ